MTATTAHAIRVVALGAFLCVGGTAAATDLDFELGASAQYFEYNEAGVEETGVLYGVTGNLTYRWLSHWVIGARGELIGSSLDYDGRTWGGAPMTTETVDVILRGDFLVGWYGANQLGEAFAYIGLGTRYWDQLIEGRGGYEREIIWHYVPIGMRLSGAGNNKPGWSWRATVEYRAIVGGVVRSHLSDVDPRFNDPVNNVSEGYGGYFSLGVAYHFAAVDSFSALSIMPFLEIWDVEATDLEVLTFNGQPHALVYEPANTTVVYGVEVSLLF